MIKIPIPQLALTVALVDALHDVPPRMSALNGNAPPGQGSDRTRRRRKARAKKKK